MVAASSTRVACFSWLSHSFAGGDNLSVRDHGAPGGVLFADKGDAAASFVRGNGQNRRLPALDSGQGFLKKAGIFLAPPVGRRGKGLMYDGPRLAGIEPRGRLRRRVAESEFQCGTSPGTARRRNTIPSDFIC